MRKYTIPANYIPGFEKIIKLSPDEVTEFSKIISDFKIGEKLETILDKPKVFLKHYSEEDIQIMLRSLVSLVDIFEDAKGDVDKFTTNFSESYSFSNPKATERDNAVLKSNLSLLLSGSGFNSIRVTSKANDIIVANKNNFKTARVLSDIRLVFDEKLDSDKKTAVVVHNLKLDYYKDAKPRSFYISLDLSDLKLIRNVIERAIEKDRIIRETKHVLEFIDI
jgi:hypothetical protein